MSAGASMLAYALLGAGVLVLSSRAEETAAESIDVTFAPGPEPEPVKVDVPPPLPIVPAGMAAKKVAGLRAPAPLVAPEEIPDAKPEEAEPTGDAIEVPEGAGEGEPGGRGPAVTITAAPEPPPPPLPPPPPPPVKNRADPINLPEAATPPVADAGNVSPEYPEAARTRGLEGQVILKIVVSEAGEVTEVNVMRGDEPFVAAAVAAVKTWRYSPALVDGKPTAVFRIVKIPFRLKT